MKKKNFPQENKIVSKLKIRSAQKYKKHLEE